MIANDPGSKEARERSFAGGTYGVTIRTRDDDWLLVWEPDQEVNVVRYIGPDPFA